MLFETKKALLEYKGKKSNDNKLVDRMILRGEVRVVDGMYEIVDKDEIIEELKREIENLKKKNDQILKDSKVEELEEAKVQWEYWENQTRRYVDYLEKVISVTYDKVKPMLWNKIGEKSEFRENIIEEVKSISKYKD